MQNRKKMHPIVHNSTEFKEARKAFQGINSTAEGSKQKSIKRHDKKKDMAKKMKNKEHDWFKGGMGQSFRGNLPPDHHE